MTTLDTKALEALIAHIRACANGTDLLQDGAFQMSARRTIRKALNDAADALSALPAQPVAVKPLGWGNEEDRGSAQTIAGFYRYVIGDDGVHWSLDGVRQGRCDSVREAKAAAQADFEQRILSALEGPSP